MDKLAFVLSLVCLAALAFAAAPPKALLGHVNYAPMSIAVMQNPPYGQFDVIINVQNYVEVGVWNGGTTAPNKATTVLGTYPTGSNEGALYPIEPQHAGYAYLTITCSSLGPFNYTVEVNTHRNITESNYSDNVYTHQMNCISPGPGLGNGLK